VENAVRVRAPNGCGTILQKEEADRRQLLQLCLHVFGIVPVSSVCLFQCQEALNDQSADVRETQTSAEWRQDPSRETAVGAAETNARTFRRQVVTNVRWLSVDETRL
jgi:hypothetical protein